MCSHLFWSPAGQYIVLAECREVGALEFIDTTDFSTMASGEHYKATNVEWDPTGRYVVSSVSAWNHKVIKDSCNSRCIDSRVLVTVAACL